jgi:hypothetical protein
VANKDFQIAIDRLLAAHEIPAWHYARRGKHMSVVFDHGGRRHTVIFPGTPGDRRRGPLNLISYLRRELRRAAP